MGVSILVLNNENCLPQQDFKIWVDVSTVDVVSIWRNLIFKIFAKNADEIMIVYYIHS